MNNLTLCPACGARVEFFKFHIKKEHPDLIKYITKENIEKKKKVNYLPKKESIIKPLTQSRTETIVHPPAILGSAYRCEFCDSDNVRIIDSRKVDSYVLRRRECVECKTRFSTYELRIGKDADVWS